jgi:hypothetical protein
MAHSRDPDPVKRIDTRSPPPSPHPTHVSDAKPQATTTLTDATVGKREESVTCKLHGEDFIEKLVDGQYTAHIDTATGRYAAVPAASTGGRR